MGGKPALLVVLASLLLLCAFLLSHLSSSPTYNELDLPRDARGSNAGACLMTYSSPSFLRLHSFGREYSRLGAGPWGLYLYREAGWDPDPFPSSGKVKLEDFEEGLPVQLHLTGTPVIFVPGNAGSFRQARSLASTSTRLYYDLPSVRRKSSLFPKVSAGGRPLDWFALDFNDDFSAFHGQTLRDQAEYLADSIRYVLSLYHRKPLSRSSSSSLLPDPTSVIVVAHSMGGIVARAAILHSHFQANSIATLITIATPHTVPPASVDRAIDTVYSEINAKWRDSPPSDLAFISIGGGLSDTTISSESVSLSSLLPQNHSSSVTVFASTLIGTPVDHLALLWCSQILQSLASALIQIVDVRNPEGVIGLPNRLDKIRNALVGNLESALTKPLPPSSPASSPNFTFSHVTQLSLGERLTLPSLSKISSTSSVKIAYALPVPKTRTYTSNKIFSLITSAEVGRSKDAKIEVWACVSFTPSHLPSEEAPAFAHSDGKANQCTPLAPAHLSHLPASPHPSSLAARLHPDERKSLQLVEVSSEGLVEEWIIVIVKSGGETEAWVMAEWADGEKRVKVIEKTGLQLLFSSYKLDGFPSTPALVSELWFPALDSSLVVFSVKVFRSQCQETRSRFLPLLRTYSPLVFESTFHPSPASSPYRISLHTHASGPFQHPPLSPFAPSSSGGRLQVFIDPSCGGNDLAMEIKVDVWKTVGTWGVRWRMAFVSMPFVIVLSVLCGQVSRFNKGDPYPSFFSTYAHFLLRHLPLLLLFVTVLTLLQSVLLSSSTATTTWVQDALLGTKQPMFFFVPAMVLFALSSVVAIEAGMLWCLVESAALVAALIKKNRGVSNEERGRGDSMPMPTQRLLSLALLLLVVLFFAPHQFAFLVLFLVHFGTTVRARMSASTPSPVSPINIAHDHYNYAFSTLLLMLTLLPITALILVVWVRNLAVGWLVPFSSDHNILQIVGFMVNVEQLQAGKMLQRSSGRLTSTLSVVVLSLSSLYALLYGVRYTHIIYPLGNLVSLWLAANNSDAMILVVGGGKRRRSLVAAVSSGSETSARKKGVVLSRSGSPALGSQ